MASPRVPHQDEAHKSRIPGENKFTEMLSDLRSSFNTGITRSLAFRIEQLTNLKRMLTECEDQILSALKEDLHKSEIDGKLVDIKFIQVDIDSMLVNLKKYAADKKLPLNLLTLTDKGYVRKEPFGVVLLLGTWNYPFQSSLQPMVGAIAAGNCVVLKPSEVAPTSADTMALLLPRYLDQKCYRVVTGDAETAKELLRNKFDYVFCIGSAQVGRSVMQAAAPHLTPVTLELGGKNPCYIDKSADFKIAAKRILWGKSLNQGQVCISPDYIICPEDAKEEFLRIAKGILGEFFGKDCQKSKDLPRIVNKRHFYRLKKLLEDTKGTISIGGNMNEDDLWIEPTIVVNVNPDNDALMQEEIFGPILPIISCSSITEAIRIIRSKPKPLALYIFSNDKKCTQEILESTSSGNVCVNNVVWQANWVGLPFGGVGDSGMGNFHGKYSFNTFSHRRSVLERKMDYLSEKMCEITYPPYTNSKQKVLLWFMEHFEKFDVPIGEQAQKQADKLREILAIMGKTRSKLSSSAGLETSMARPTRVASSISSFSSLDGDVLDLTKQIELLESPSRETDVAAVNSKGSEPSQKPRSIFSFMRRYSTSRTSTKNIQHSEMVSSSGNARPSTPAKVPTSAPTKQHKSFIESRLQPNPKRLPPILKIYGRSNL
ncbi:unnamed protein product [Allacma fusca]|uniref:Aldehyde dehydrogenase domain-containing protein n=1 Tax=Allacma fusca TaxID=39272 RepID=A0A8J2KSF3_9HEXA|nr:unnamed protein product [Allacma fusca]